MPTTYCMPCSLTSFNNALNKLTCNFVQVFISSWLLNTLQSFYAGSHCQRVPTQRPSLVHRSSRSHRLHNISPTSICTYWQTPSNDLPQSCYIRSYAKVFLSTSIRQTKSSHNFIKHEKGIVLLGDFAQGTKEIRFRSNETRISNNRFEEDYSYLSFVGFKDLLNSSKVIEGGCKGFIGGSFRNTRGIRKS
ncbi:hypothetical protein MtrunA17_Chr3g0145721 [Medicago truncatula]|uniref:Uncharacterized protein n=1 Tax=Medicago truncatula TaxID=3880 RepID=A0A396J0Q5_MEDTR|nr:hypothetical protein MtrunA17_Chr3g0145721 [Medicago truncatula]